MGQAAALAMAQKNWQKFEAKFASLPEKLPAPQFLTSDLLANWPIDQSIDLLIANLPYIPKERLAMLDSSVRDFEPLLALDGGADGLRLVDRLLNQAKSRLVPDGVIWLEVDETHTPEQLQALRPEYHYEFFSDSFGKARFMRATLIS